MKKFFPVISLLITFFISDCTSAKIVVGYYYATNSTYPHTAIDYSKLTHIAHAFVKPNANGSLSMDSWFLYPELITTAHQHGVKIVVALGGWGNSDGFSPMAANEQSRADFISNIINFCLTYGYNGVDLDWEYPKEADRANFVALVKELREALNTAGLEFLSAALPSTDWNNGYDIQQLVEYFDWFGIMTYDFYGPWEATSGHNSPLYSSSSQYGSTDRSINYYLGKGVPKDKLCIGIPFYGYDFKAPGMFKTHSGAASISYANIFPKLNSDWEYLWDNTSKAPYLVNQTRTDVITFDDTVSIKLKSEYVYKNDLAGTIIWKIGHDYLNGDTQLLNMIEKYMLNHPTEIPTIPRLAFPANASIIDTNIIVVKWFTTDSATAYNLQLSTSENFDSLVTNKTGINLPEQKLTNLENNTSYYWRVSSSNINGSGDWSGAWSFTTDLPVTSVEETIITTEFQLYNYPNPFNAQTKIGFTISSEALVNLSVYNILGQQEIVLVNEKLCSGNHEFVWNANNYSSGVYLVRINVIYEKNNKVVRFSESKKISLVK